MLFIIVKILIKVICFFFFDPEVVAAECNCLINLRSFYEMNLYDIFV